jgi:hypothetical protein
MLPISILRWAQDSSGSYSPVIGAAVHDVIGNKVDLWDGSTSFNIKTVTDLLSRLRPRADDSLPTSTRLVNAGRFKNVSGISESQRRQLERRDG